MIFKEKKMRLLKIAIIFLSLNIFSHGTAISSSDSFFITFNEDNKLVDVHSHYPNLQILKSVLSTSAILQDEIKERENFFREERNAIPVGFYLLEFLDSDGLIVYNGVSSPLNAYASHYGRFKPEIIPNAIVNLPVQMPNNPAIASLRVYKKETKDTFLKLEEFKILLKTDSGVTRLPGMSLSF